MISSVMITGREAWDGGCGGEKPGITHRIVAIEFDLCALVAFDFNRDRFLCAFYWVHNG
jgi:hypothetical protein